MKNEIRIEILNVETFMVLVIYISFAILMSDRRCGNDKGKSYIKDGQ